MTGKPMDLGDGKGMQMFQINKGSSQIRAAIPYLTDQIRAMVSLALIRGCPYLTKFFLANEADQVTPGRVRCK